MSLCICLSRPCTQTVKHFNVHNVFYSEKEERESSKNTKTLYRELLNAELNHYFQQSNLSTSHSTPTFISLSLSLSHKTLRGRTFYLVTVSGRCADIDRVGISDVELGGERVRASIVV